MICLKIIYRYFIIVYREIQEGIQEVLVCILQHCILYRLNGYYCFSLFFILFPSVCVSFASFIIVIAFRSFAMIVSAAAVL